MVNLTNLDTARILLEMAAKPLNLYEAKTHLSELVDRASAGEVIVIAKSGRPLARLGPLPAHTAERKPGGGKGRVWLSSDFDASLPKDLQRAFAGDDGD